MDYTLCGSKLQANFLPAENHQRDQLLRMFNNMAILTVSNLSVSFADRTLFDNISFRLERGDKVGLIGANGTGKTTLFRVLTGRLEQSGGGVVKEKDLRLGYMEQYSCSNSDNTVYSELLSVFDELIETEKQLSGVVELLENGEHSEELILKEMHLRENFERRGGLTYQSRTRAALLGLGFSESEFGRSVGELSGGQRSKLALAKLLLDGADILLLDEPTNHLDISAVNWLESFIKDYRGSVIVVSHDRYFLDEVTNKTIEIEHGRSRTYTGAYSEFMQKKEKILREERAHYEQTMNEIKRIEGIVEQQKRWGVAHNFVTAASKQKQADRLKEELTAPESELETIHFRFAPKCESGQDVLIVEELKKSFGGETVFDNVNLHIRKGERVFVLGDNGCGKTTLLKIINKLYEADAGSVYLGANVEIGYFDQVQSGLDLKKSALDQVWDGFPYMTETEVRTALGRFLFKGDDVYRTLGEMSGGERSRIALLELMLKGGNFLLLDEPTNHLDTSFREQLESTLQEYSGTMLIVSHDRYFINKLADRVLVMRQDGVTEYLGNYDYYLEKSQESAGSGIQIRSRSDGAPKEKKQNEYFRRKEERAALAKAKTRLKKCEDEIGDTEDEIKKTEQLISSDEAKSDFEALTEYTNTLTELNERLEKLYEQWEEAAHSVAELTKKNEAERNSG